jgi:hypothetical protein
MNQEKYIGMDVHQATISVAVMDGRGKLIMECILETKATRSLSLSIREFWSPTKKSAYYQRRDGCYIVNNRLQLQAKRCTE